MRIVESWSYKTNEQLLGLDLGTIKKIGTQVVSYSRSGKIFLFSLDGKLFFETNCTDNTPIWYLKMHDVNNDGEPEIILGGMDGILRTFQISVPLSLILLWEHKFDSSISGFLLEDINLDRNIELIAYSLDKSLRVLQSSNGFLIWGQVFADGIEDACIWRDNNLTNKKEILACGNDGTIRVFESNNGDLLWIKHFTDKIRCISYLTSKGNDFIVCGGDDKIIHIINKKTQKEIKNIPFEDYIWKSYSLPIFHHKKLLISSYSFSYFNQAKNVQDLKFSSKLICINKKLEIDWELKNVNVECLCQININEQKVIGIGTTKGELLVLNVENGEILSKIKNPSSLSGLIHEPSSNLLISCHENGQVYAYYFD